MIISFYAKSNASRSLALLVLMILAIFPLRSGADDLVSTRSYDLPLQDGYKSFFEVFLTDSGPVLVLEGPNGLAAYDGASGHSIQRQIRGQEVIRSLGFVPAQEMRGLLSMLGCAQASLGCTSPDDANFVVKADVRGDSIRITYYSLEALWRSFISAASGETAIEFGQRDRTTIESLVMGQSPGIGHWNWRDAVIEKIYEIKDINLFLQTKENLNQFSFVQDAFVIALRKFNNSLIEESFLDLLGQRGCRLVATAIARAEQSSDPAWLDRALQLAMIDQCSAQSVHFRFGLLEGPRETRPRLAANLMNLGCKRKSMDYWCAGVALDGASCDQVTMQSKCPAPAPGRSAAVPIAPRKQAGTTIPDIPAKDRIRLYQFSETMKKLIRDERSVSVAFYSKPPEKSADGNFTILARPTGEGIALAKNDLYRMTVLLSLEITRKDNCTNPVLCIFSSSDHEHRRVEQRNLTLCLQGSQGGERQVPFGALRPEDRRLGFTTELRSVRLIVDKIITLDKVTTCS